MAGEELSWVSMYPEAAHRCCLRNGLTQVSPVQGNKSALMQATPCSIVCAAPQTSQVPAVGTAMVEATKVTAPTQQCLGLPDSLLSDIARSRVQVIG